MTWRKNPTSSMQTMKIITHLLSQIQRCSWVLCLLVFVGHASAQSTMEELQTKVENRMSMRASEGYVQTFPVGRSVLRIPVQMNTKEVLSEVRTWPRPSGRYYSAFKNNEIATLQMFAQLMDNHRNEELVERVVGNVQREAQRFGLNPSNFRSSSSSLGMTIGRSRWLLRI